MANKVVVGLGLCLALYDITDIGKSFVFPGDSATHTKVLLWILMEEHVLLFMISVAIKYLSLSVDVKKSR